MPSFVLLNQNTTIMIILLPQVKIEAAGLLMVKVVTNNSEASHREAEAKDLSTINDNSEL